MGLRALLHVERVTSRISATMARLTGWLGMAEKVGRARPTLTLPQPLVGRDNEIARILREIPQNHLVLTGEPGVGKTAILRHLERRLVVLDDPRQLLFPVYVSLEGVPQGLLFLTLAAAVCGSLPARPGGQSVPADQGIEPESGCAFRLLTRELRRQIEALRQVDPREAKIVLLIDDAHQLNRYDPRVNQKLRSLFMTGLAESLVAVAAGREIDRSWSLPASPWFNFFEEMPIGPISEDEAEQLVRQALAGKVEVEPAALEQLVARLGPWPGALLAACDQILACTRSSSRGKKPLGVADVLDCLRLE